jgi:hypothetical protein
MIQHFGALVMNRKVAAYGIPAFAGMTARYFAGSVPNHEPTKNPFSALAVVSGFSSVKK